MDSDTIDQIKLDPDVGAVIVGFDEHLSLPKIVKACSYLKNPECLFVATNIDQQAPFKRDIAAPAAGCMVAAIEYSTGRKPILIGKPGPYIRDFLIKRLNINPHKTLFIGDRMPVVLGNIGPSTWLVLGAACVAAVGAAWLARRRFAVDRPPTKWRKVGKLTGLSLYPLKSGRAVHLKEAAAMERGLEEMDTGDALKLRDRFLVVLAESDGTFVTARKYPCLLLVTVKADGRDAVILSAPGQPDLRVKLPASEGAKLRQVKMWFNEIVDTVDCGDEAAAWLTRLIKPTSEETIPTLRLGYDLELQIIHRTVDEGPFCPLKDAFPALTSEDMGSYADLTSYMMMSESSVEDLRTRLPTDATASLTVRQFRPNFVVNGAPPYAEDSWEWLKIGEHAVFRKVKPCTRCIMTTMNPDSSERNKQMEPLKTLKTYRKLKSAALRKLEGESPVLGIHLGLRQSGIVHVDDDVYVGI